MNDNNSKMIYVLTIHSDDVIDLTTKDERVFQLLQSSISLSSINIHHEVVRNSQGTCFNDIHPLKFSLVKAIMTASLRGLLCQSLYVRGRRRFRELRVVNCEYLELRVVETAGMD